METGALIADRFEIVGEGGRGGMASVHRALDRQTGEAVAIKVLHASASDMGERFLREAEVLARLEHPGIVGYVAHGDTGDDRTFLAMRWIEGETLAARVKRLGKLPPAATMEMGARLAEALAEAHAAGVVHRDVKPANILLATEGYDHPVLVDFGVARLGEGASPMTQEGLLIGTPGYISPEQARGLLHVDARADQFSLGCVLYGCLAGRAPYRGDDLVGVLAKVLFQETPHVRSERPEVPSDLDAVIAKAMAKEPEDRFRDATALAQALAKAHAHHTRGDLPTAQSQAPMTTPGISGTEARLAAIVIVSRPPGVTDDATFVGRRFGGDVERLANGGVVIRFLESATERALAAARCALALRDALPTTPISLATVRGTGSDDDIVKAIDRAAELARDARRPARPHVAGAQPVRIDETTAGLLDARFDVRRSDGELELVGERHADESRMLLGIAVPCVGRDRELLTLDATLEEVESEGIARAVVVIADAGVGKSRLRREWLQRIRDRGDDVTVWTARADPLDARAPHGLLGQAVRRALGIADDEPQATKQKRLREHLATVLDEAAALRVFPFAAEIVGAPLDDDASPHLAAARADRALMADHIRRAFEEWVVALCTKPLLVVLDDAHWGDAATLRLLDAGLKAAADHPLMVAVFARPSLRAGHPALFAERRVQELRLEELSKRSAERLARAILGSDMAASVVERVVTLSNGNAFFLEELVRAVAAGKGGMLPESVLSVVESRLEALEPDARRVLRAASVFGQFFWPGGVSAVLGDTDEEAARAWIGALARREVVTLRAQSRYGDEPELTFRHVLVRDTAYSMLTPEDRAIAHRAAAVWLERRGEQEPGVLAAHFEAAGEGARAAVQYLRAATQMLGSGDLEAARELAGRGLACSPPDDLRAELLMADADASRWLGDLERALHAAEEVMLLVSPSSETYMKALAAALLGHLKLGRTERRRELVAVAMRCVEHAAATSAACRLAAQSGIVSLFAGDIAPAELVDARIDRFADAPDIDEAAIALVHIFRAFLSDATGDLEAQVRHFDAASECFTRIGDERSALLQKANGAFARTLLGDYAESQKRLREALAAAEAVGLTFIVDTVHCHLAETLHRMGLYEEARVHAELAVDGFRAEKDKRMECGSLTYLARALASLGETERALATIEAAVTLARTARQMLPTALATLAEMEISAGRSAEALAHTDEAMATLREVHTDGSSEIGVRVAHARALGAMGRTDAARAALSEARAILDGRMATIRDDHFRVTFARVEENALLLAHR